MPGVLMILIANLIWGAAPPIFKYALTDIPPFTLAFIRFFGAGILFLPFAFKHQKSLTNDEFKNILWGALCGISINIAAFFLALPLAPSINAHILGSLGPIVLYVLSLIMLKEQAHPQILKGMIISVLGTLVIVFAPLVGFTPSVSHGVSPVKELLGNGLFLLSMLGATLMVIYNKRVSGTVNPALLTAMQFFIGAMTFAPLMAYELQSWSFSQLTSASWVGIIYGTFFSSALAYFLHNYALSKMDAQKFGIYGYIMPVVAVLVAIPLIGEYPDLFFIIGSILIFIGIYISERHPHLKEMHKKLHSK